MDESKFLIKKLIFYEASSISIHKLENHIKNENTP